LQTIRRQYRRGVPSRSEILATVCCKEGQGRAVKGPDVTWYLGVAAFMFATGALGVLLRRSPLIVLLSLELMLNACNLALIAFSRLHGGGAGQIFALSVMAVAASEVVVGLGLIVAMARKRLVLDVDKLTSLRG
jgi:NADH-quinone oxidoreductase subunit K